MGADIAEQLRLGSDLRAIPQPLKNLAWLQTNFFDLGYNTLSDLTQVSLAHFNSRYPGPRRSSTVDGVTRPLRSFALSSDANLDGSIASDGVTRTITSNETIGMPSFPVVATTSTWQRSYNFAGITTGLELTPIQHTGGSGPAYSVRPIQLSSGFLLNDFIVTTDSQSYHLNPGAFESLVNPADPTYFWGQNRLVLRLESLFQMKQFHQQKRDRLPGNEPTYRGYQDSPWAPSVF